MNNNLPDDLNNPTTNTSNSDTNLDTNLDSNLHAIPTTATSYGDSSPDETTQDVEFALSSLENVIRQRLSIIEKSQLELSELRQQLNDIMANSEEFYKADKAYKEAQKLKKQVKSTIMGTQEAKTIQGKFDESKQMLKDNENALSDMLVEYYETMRIKEIDDLEGNQRDLIVKIKVAPPKQK